MLFHVHRTQAPTTVCWSSVVLRPQNHRPQLTTCWSSVVLRPSEHRPQRPPVGRVLFHVHRTQAPTTACWSSVVLRPQNTGHNDCWSTLFYVHRTQATTTACWSSVVLRPQNTGHNDRLLVDCCFTSTEHRPQRPPVGRLLFYVHRTQATTTACWSTVVLRPQNTGHNDRLLVERCFTSTEHRPQRPPVGRALFYVHRTQATTTACWSTVVLRPQNTGHNDRLLVECCFTSQNTGHNDRLLVERCFTSTEHRPQRPPVGRVLFYVHRNRRLIPRTATSTFTQLLSSGL